MNGSTLNQVTLQIRAQQKRKKWQILVSVLASVVVFVTTYLLILPAITKETKTYCGLEEHNHTDECYSCYADFAETGVPADHTHDECELICGFEEHSHSEMCYINFRNVVIKMRYDSREIYGDSIDNGDLEAENKELVNEAAESEETTEVSEEDSNSKDSASESEDKEVKEDEENKEAKEDKENEESEDNEYIVEWERHISVKDGEALIKYIDGISTLPNGFEVKDATWYNAEDDKEFSLTSAVMSDLVLYADFYEVPEEEKEEETFSESETTSESESVTEAQTTTEAPTTTTKPNNILKLADTFTYENDDFIVNLKVDGNVKLADGQTVKSDDKAELVVRLADKADESYNALADYAKETRNPLNVVAMQVMQFNLVKDGEELDLSDCNVKAEIKPTNSLLSDIETTIEEDEKKSNSQVAAAISAYEQVDDEIKELDSIYPYDEDEEGDTLEFDVTSNTIALYSSTTANPHFKVEYKAFIDTLASSGDVGLDIIIDTSADANGGKPTLPTNAVKTPKTKEIFIDYTSSSKTKGVIAMNDHYNSSGELIDGDWTDVFTSEEFEYIKAPNISHFNKFYGENNYELVQVKINHNGVWHAFVGDLSKLHFTNRTETATDLSKYNTWISLGATGKNNSTSKTFSDVNEDIYVIIDDNTTIQLAAKPTIDTYNNKATFYDYDISDGYIYGNKTNAANQTNAQNTSTQDNNTKVFANTKASGINSESNYKDSSPDDVRFAFGNVNTATIYGNNEWKGNNLNKANFAAKSYKCTFEMVSHLDENGNIVYSDELSVPNLFDEGPAIGKEVYDNYSLDFDRNGDTYTLFAVNGAGSNATNLNHFNNPTCGTKTYTTIWTNNFWPMDSALSFGTDGHDLKFGNYDNRANRCLYTGSAFPPSDDGIDHNSYFGMHFAVDFTLTEDYIGPLEYTFFGDDDMWVFLDGQLVCDIGGVHSTVGQYVNLWDYLNKGDAGTHELSFFYTERGASGSSCFMQFTLPSVASATPEQDTGELRIEKEITGPLETQFEFEFDINFTDANGNHLLDDYSYSRYTKDGELIEWDIIVWDGGTFRLRNGEYIIVKYLPDGTKYTVTEHSYDDYNTSVYLVKDGEIVPGSTATGSIDIHSTKQLEIRIINEVDIELPATGGSGITNYILGGSFLLTAASIYGYRLRYKRRKERIKKVSP